MTLSVVLTCVASVAKDCAVYKVDVDGPQEQYGLWRNVEFFPLWYFYLFIFTVFYSALIYHNGTLNMKHANVNLLQFTSSVLSKTRAVALMKTLKIHIPCKLRQSGLECPRVHYWRHTWINYRPSALQRFHDVVPSWSEADALCGLPREQSALFIRAARGGEVRWRVRRGRGEQNTLDSRLNTKLKRLKHFVHPLPLVDVPHFSCLFVLVAAVF